MRANTGEKPYKCEALCKFLIYIHTCIHTREKPCICAFLWRYGKASHVNIKTVVWEHTLEKCQTNVMLGDLSDTYAHIHAHIHACKTKALQTRLSLAVYIRQGYEYQDRSMWVHTRKKPFRCVVLQCLVILIHAFIHTGEKLYRRVLFCLYIRKQVMWIRRQ